MRNKPCQRLSRQTDKGVNTGAEGPSQSLVIGCSYTGVCAYISEIMDSLKI